MLNLVHVLQSDGGTQDRMRFLALLIVSSSCGQDTLFQAVQKSTPGVRYQVVVTDEGVTLLELEDDIIDGEEIDNRQDDQGVGGLAKFKEIKKVGQWIQKTQEASLSKETDPGRTQGSVGLGRDKITSELRRRGNLLDSDLRRLWLEFNSRGSVRRGSGSVSDIGGSSVLGSRGGDLFDDIVQKTEPGVWYQFTRDERGERLVQAKKE